MFSILCDMSAAQLQTDQTDFPQASPNIVVRGVAEHVGVLAVKDVQVDASCAVRMFQIVT